MVKTNIVLGIVLGILLVTGLYLAFSASQNPNNTMRVIDNPQENIIEITSEGFSPSTLTINKGESVTFINQDSEGHWPASAMHPTHTVYPGVNYDAEGSFAGSQACVSEGVAKEGAFDPCKTLQEGESWTFTFDQVGSWNYHDHLKAGMFGKIIVQDN